MSLDRDELAARCLVARLSALNAAGAYRANADAIAENAIDCTDALLARLRPEAVAPAPSRPEWVRITGPKDAVNVTVGKAYRVIYVTDEGNLAINNDEGVARHLPRRGEYVTRVFPSWEPCAAPSPAASPAPYVPRAGDVVTVVGGEEFHSVWMGAVGVVVAGDAQGFWVEMRYAPNNPEFKPNAKPHVRRCSLRNPDPDVRPATSSERAAAGLPVDESAVDRVALAKVLWEASREVTPAATRARPWDEATEVGRRQSLAAADAAIAFMAKGPAFDRAEFNEAQEREAALDAYRAGADGCIDPEGTKYPACRDSFRNGWLARARVAAKGGA